MSTQTTSLQERIASGKTILLAEIHPPGSADPAGLRTAAKRYAGKVHAVGVSDNRDRVAMSALAAASLLKAEGLEPILHVTTRDRNRIALVSEALGAQALGIRNLLCTSGTHQTLGNYRAARNVYDIDTVQLLQTYANLASDCGLLGESGLEGAGPFCLGAVASPDAGPPDLQLMRLAKKVQAGAKFLVTQPVFDPERFEAWWETVARRGLNEQVAILAGIRPLSDGDVAPAQAGLRPLPGIPDALAGRVASLSDPVARRAASFEIALETIHRLSKLPGIRGFCISADGDHKAVLQLIEDSGMAGDGSCP
ncbi:MAG: methylenetetrahydrofolate reductase [bacterium]|jgi:methylenetetrahydrofolate reductase (NADPH)